MSIRTVLTLAFATTAALSVSGCLGTLQTVNTVAQGAMGAKGGYQAYENYDSVKQMKNAPAVFEEYKAVKVETLLQPREAGKAEELSNAFKDNMGYLVRKDLGAVELPMEVCEAPCDTDKAPSLKLQFKEEGYDANLAQTLAAGAKLRGTLYYINTQTDEVVHQEELEMAENYGKLIERIHMAVVTKAAKTARQELKTIKEKEGEEAARKRSKEINEAMTGIDPIKPEYKELFQTT